MGFSYGSWTTLGLLGGSALAFSGCLEPTYVCFADSECTGVDGQTCEANGRCSRADPTCGGEGRRYLDNAGKFAGECVEPPGDGLTGAGGTQGQTDGFDTLGDGSAGGSTGDGVGPGTTGDASGTGVGGSTGGGESTGTPPTSTGGGTTGSTSGGGTTAGDGSGGSSSGGATASSTSGGAGEDQCNTTAECRDRFGPQATDCANSASDMSVCMCGDVPCE